MALIIIIDLSKELATKIIVVIIITATKIIIPNYYATYFFINLKSIIIYSIQFDFLNYYLFINLTRESLLLISILRIPQAHHQALIFLVLKKIIILIETKYVYILIYL